MVLDQRYCPFFESVSEIATERQPMSGPDYVYANGNGNGNGSGSGGNGNRRRSSHNGNGLSGGSLESVYQPVNLFNGVEIQNILHNNFERYRSKAVVYEDGVRTPCGDGAGGEEHEFTMVSSSANGSGSGNGNSYGGERYGYDRGSYSGRKGKDLLSELSKSMMHMHPHTHKNSGSMTGGNNNSNSNSGGSGQHHGGSHFHYHQHYQQQQQQ